MGYGQEKNEQSRSQPILTDAEAQKIAKVRAAIYGILRRQCIGHFFLVSSLDNVRIPSSGRSEAQSLSKTE